MRFLSPPDYEAPADSDADNEYDIFVHANDGVHDTSLSVTISVTDGNDTLIGGAGNDSLSGGAQNDSLSGGDGNDTLDGGPGNDTLDGGNGNDSLVGGAGDDTLMGLAGNDTLDGSAGNDSMLGGSGNDIYIVDSATDHVVENAGEGTDTIRTTLASYSLASLANFENLAFIGTGNFTGTGSNAANTILGADGNDTLAGGQGNDTLSGGNGADSLNGGAGADSMAGGDGNDLYAVDNPGDVVTESAGQGIDKVTSSVSFTLSANVENLTLSGGAAANGTGNELANTITGTSGANLLSGLDGNDSLSGGAGNDTLLGGDGNDTLNGTAGADSMAGGTGDDNYIVDNLSDVISENPNEGTDLVTSSVAYTISANVEKLTLSGSAGLNGTGNALDNAITGNSGANSLVGLAGNDTLDGGAGADSMAGGAGNDNYFVDNIGDAVTESLGEGIDTVNTKLAAYTLGSNVENLNYVGGAKINGAGNELDNLIAGGAGKDTLNGGAGADILTGGGGADRFVYKPGEIAAGDAVADFSHAQGDKIDVSAIDAIDGGADNAFTFIGTAAFTAAGQLHYAVSGGNAILEGNTDGLGGANFSIVLDGVGSLVASDFIL